MASQTGVELTPAAAMAAASLMAACNQINHRSADQSNWGFGSNQSQSSMFNSNSGIENGNSVVLVTNLNAEVGFVKFLWEIAVGLSMYRNASNLDVSVLSTVRVH